MAYAYKHKNNPQRFAIKPSRTPISAYRYAISYKNIITTIIIIIVAIVTILAICVGLFNSERQITQKIETLAANYYENVFYAGMLASDNYNGDPESALQKYATNGISPVTLRQLILLNDNISSSDANFIKQHCDENDTYVIFHPETPYSQTSYSTEFTYSCDF